MPAEMQLPNADEDRRVVQWLFDQLEKDLVAMQGTTAPEGRNLLCMLLDNEELGPIRSEARCKRATLTESGPSSTAKLLRRHDSGSSSREFLTTALDSPRREAPSKRMPPPLRAAI